MIKSPICYQGNKFKLLPQILPLFPKEIDCFLDIFGGSGTVLLNIDAKHYIYNELNSFIYDLFCFLFEIEESKIQEQIINSCLNSENLNSFLEFRKEYNKSPSIEKLFILMCHSFSNQIRFNSKKEFNVPFGKRTLTDANIKNIQETRNFLRDRKIKCSNLDFSQVGIPSEAFIYVDPPYLNSCAVYNENEGWNEYEESRLQEWLCSLNVKWALSNELTKNPGLEIWAMKKGFKINELSNSYSSCNYQRKKSNTREVLITNYEN